MHLKQLKLAGFKSFVEPTVVSLRSQLVAVVGPNGCGKSNIIDAVRWVLGESSAKNLRGESMIDVIFNGSTTRKPLGQASVELVFDNSMGRLTGQYASYQEIAIKRIVTREGDSTYFLNGSRCRRRDITDIFLGTGAGARSYSIIGQDTISRLIEAKPEDLKSYLEEAAGVAKYRERRRETHLRIEHTRENLARVFDVREELAKQLQRLERQAKSAKQYQALKQEQQHGKMQIAALKWRNLTQEQQQTTTALQQSLTQQQAYENTLTTLTTELETVRIQAQHQDQRLQAQQVQAYQLKTDIARLEENLLQQQRDKQRIAEERQQIDEEQQREAMQLQQEQGLLAETEHALVTTQHLIKQCEQDYQQASQAVQIKQQQKTQIDNQWQQAQTLLQQAQHNVAVEQLKLSHVQQSYQQAQQRLEKNIHEKNSISLITLSDEIDSLVGEQRELQENQQLLQQQLAEGRQEEHTLRQQLATLEQALFEAQDSQQRLATEHALLQARQQVALRKQQPNAQLLPWQQQARLAELLHVPKKWWVACELVLGDHLQAVVLEDMACLWSELAALQDSAAIFVKKEDHHAPDSSNNNPYPLFAELVTGINPAILKTFPTLFAAETLQQGLSWLATLKADQSVITADGYWISPQWVRVSAKSEEDGVGLLGRQEALSQLHQQVIAIQQQVTSLQTQRKQLQASLASNTSQNNQIANSLQQCNQLLQTNTLSLTAKQQSLASLQEKLQNLSIEQDALQQDIEDQLSEKLAIETHIQQAVIHAAKQQQQFETLQCEKNAWDDTIKQVLQQQETTRQHLQQAEIQANSDKLKVQQYRESIKRLVAHLELLQTKLKLLDQQQQEPDETRQMMLQQKLDQLETIDAQLILERQQLQELEELIRTKNEQYKHAQQQSKTLQETIQQQQIHVETIAIRISSIFESTTITADQLSQLLATESINDTIALCEQRQQELDEKIRRLGAINLVAIEEFQSESERKSQLDAQYFDLEQALSLLEHAITALDKETKVRLTETFEQINASFQQIFPRLFAGGRAQLALTCDNLLEAGILVMAQPPGKRNSTIHVLSGGEKAMTAIALVFAIFRLNPSPFCMLDEVDAPLDEANVGRFCEMVKEMAQYVQFLFITHNKVTMELADNLIGVTMGEPGVSRLVAVDVAEALAYTAE